MKRVAIEKERALDDWNGRARRPGTGVSRQTASRLRSSMTPQEVKVWAWLREHLHPVGWKFRRQERIGPYVVDFASYRPKVVIEIDGDSHHVGDGPERDAVRDRFLGAEGFLVLRIPNADVGSDGASFVDRLLPLLPERVEVPS